MTGSFTDNAATSWIDVFICCRPQMYSDATEWISVLVGQVIPAAFCAATLFKLTVL
jgi:hypothetical protein